MPPLDIKRQMVLHVPSVETADGLMQWPGTRGYLQERLGPTTLVVLEKDAEALNSVLGELGIAVRIEA
jgi:hypothetical protein